MHKRLRRHYTSHLKQNIFLDGGINRGLPHVYCWMCNDCRKWSFHGSTISDSAKRREVRQHHITWGSYVTSSHHKREGNTHRMKELHSHLEGTVQQFPLSKLLIIMIIKLNISQNSTTDPQTKILLLYYQVMYHLFLE